MDEDYEAQLPLMRGALEKQHDVFEQAKSSPNQTRTKKFYHARNTHLLSWAAQTCLFLTSLFILLHARHDQAGVRCVEKLSAFSPALEAVDDEYRWERFHGSVFGSSIYTGRPNNETLARWEDIVEQPILSIDHQTLVALGAPEDSVQIPQRYGGGYMASLEVFHFTHCIQELWTHTWPEYYQSDAGEEHSIHRKHLDHCADLLRQKILCDGDVGIITYNWVKHVNHPTPNFNIGHKCRNMDRITSWVHDNGIKLSDGPLTKPPNASERDDFP